MPGHEMTGDKPAPVLAADTAEVLAEADVDAETIALRLASASELDSRVGPHQSGSVMRIWPCARAHRDASQPGSSISV